MSYYIQLPYFKLLWVLQKRALTTEYSHVIKHIQNVLSDITLKTDLHVDIIAMKEAINKSNYITQNQSSYQDIALAQFETPTEAVKEYIVTYSFNYTIRKLYVWLHIKV